MTESRGNPKLPCGPFPKAVRLLPPQDVIAAALTTAISKCESRDMALLSENVNERSVTHRIAIYLESCFEDWDVDCEYNRVGDTAKALNVPRASIAWDDLEAKTVYPDIIVHRRGSLGPNLLVVEVKKVGATGVAFDRIKLHAYMEQLQYRYGVLLRFRTGGSAGFLKYELLQQKAA